MIYKVFLNEGAMRAVGAHIEIVADGVEIEASGILSLLRNEAGLQATKAKFNHTAWSYYTVHEEPKPVVILPGDVLRDVYETELALIQKAEKVSGTYTPLTAP